MIFALLAKFLTHSPPLVQSIVVGLCTGLFVGTSTAANDRKVVIAHVLIQVIVVGIVSAALFYIGLNARGRNPSTDDAARWMYGVYAVVWLGALVAAVAALLGEGGFKAAAFAIVPLVLLAPPAFVAFRFIARRGRT